MRTTLTLDDDVAARLQSEARRSGRPFKAIVNEHLRASLSRQKTLRGVAPFVIQPCNLGGPASGAYDNIAELLDDIEDASHR